LIEELKNILKVNNDRILLSLFFGGGTPNMLAPKDFRRLMHFIKTNFIFSPDAHLSLEASPTIFSQEFAEILAEYEFTRICLGVQTFNENKLIYINRRFQKNRDVYRAVKFLKNVGFHNYCFDMIYGLSLGETANDFLKDNLKHIVKLQPIKVDLYALQHYKKFPETIRNFPSENMDIIKKKINHYLYRFKSKKLKIPTIGFDTNKLTAEHSQYFYLRRILLKDTIAIGLGGVGNYWVENKYLKVKSQEMHAWREYMSRALNGKISYKYYVLDPEEAIRKYIHYGLHTWYGIREDVIHNTFPEYIDTFQDIITQAKHTLKFVNNKILLRSDFEKRLPLKTRNEFVNYFIFAYCYLYSEKNQKEFLSRALSLLD
jgi:coproporphyrinogen III oxidase-like Fe-S oxidoreductase